MGRGGKYRPSCRRREFCEQGKFRYGSMDGMNERLISPG